MKFPVIFQIIVILAALLVWDMLHISYQHQLQSYHREIEQLPLIVFSRESSVIDSLRNDLSRTESVKSIKVEVDSTISASIIELYDLDYAGEILQNFTLPNVMEIRFKGRLYDRSRKTRLENLLLNKYPDLIMNFDSDLWFGIRKKIDFLDKIYLYGNFIYIALFLFITVFLRVHFEIKSDEYWKVFKMSGGHLELRRKRYVLNSLTYLIIPFALSLAVYLGAFLLDHLPYRISPRLFAAQFIAVLVSILISGIIIGSRKK